MKKSFIVLGLLVLALTAIPAWAATANFQANCASGIPTYCVFDATRAPSGQTGTSCGSASISSYFWDFGDGNSLFTTSSFVSHTYTQAYCDTDFVDLAVFCSDSSSATKSQCYCSTFGVNGCIRPGAGWTP